MTPKYIWDPPSEENDSPLASLQNLAKLHSFNKILSSFCKT